MPKPATPLAENPPSSDTPDNFHRLCTQVEMGCRILMVTILLTAGTSKFMSDGGFATYYSGLFQGDLRIVLPKMLVDSYLAVIPFIEISLGLLLAIPRYKTAGLIGWFAFMLSLLVGHYILQEWSSVNQLLDYFFLGFLFHLLPLRGPEPTNQTS